MLYLINIYALQWSKDPKNYKTRIFINDFESYH